MLASLQLARLPTARQDPSNGVERSPAAVELGRRLFFDTRLSGNGAVSCASCHDPARHFQDGREVAVGLGVGSRRTMPIVAAGYGAWLFWDGRKDSLWSQALGPLESPLEHGTNRLQLARLMERHYREPYTELFGPLPDLEDLPASATPAGTFEEAAAWQAMEAGERASVSRVLANIGKAIAAYESSLRPSASRLDLYLAALTSGVQSRATSLDEREIRGLRLFIGKGQCVACHSGPLLTDQQFHNTGVPARDPHSPDRGRAAALAALRDDEFNCLGPYSDAPPEQCAELRFLASQDTRLEGAFKTPGLRGVALRGPYMHAGQLASLEAVVRHYVGAPRAAVGESELRHPGRAPIRLSAAEQRDLVAFLGSLSAPVSEAPATVAAQSE